MPLSLILLMLHILSIILASYSSPVNTGAQPSIILYCNGQALEISEDSFAYKTVLALVNKILDSNLTLLRCVLPDSYVNSRVRLVVSYGEHVRIPLNGGVYVNASKIAIILFERKLVYKDGSKYWGCLAGDIDYLVDDLINVLKDYLSELSPISYVEHLSFFSGIKEPSVYTLSLPFIPSAFLRNFSSYVSSTIKSGEYFGLIVGRGLKNTGGYWVKLISVNIDYQRKLITFLFYARNPRPGEIVIQVLTEPASMVVITSQLKPGTYAVNVTVTGDEHLTYTMTITVED